ncbi:MAG: two-component hybrid sensor and regulator [uncultured bacterium]|nr:MAG: two-component hybrid sensor and regulator [uncultured bacterium]
MKKDKILVVEDEIAIANMIKRVIEMESSSYDVDLASDGREGLLMAEKGNYDLILLDMMLPRLNGLELCRSLRYKGITTPVIMLTAKDTIEDRMAATEAGANDYLSKPFLFDDLLLRINTLVESGKDEKLEPGDFEKQSDLKKKSVNAFDINQRIMDSVPVSIITIDNDGYMTSANKYYENFSRTNSYHYHNIFESKFFVRENLINDYKKLLSDGTMVKRDHCFERNNKGEDKYLKIIAVPLVDKNGNIDGALSMALDNTESVQLQKKLQLMNEELEKKVIKRTIQLKNANEEIAKVMELKSMFVADVSHEMRTSLAIIQGNVELMSMGLIEKTDHKKTYNQVFGEISRMSTMLTDMTLLSESETSKQRLDITTFDINKIISDTCVSLKVVAKEKNIKISHKRSSAKINLSADVSQIEKLIKNLVSNAIRYNKECGIVDVWVENPDSGVVINVKDSGIGIAKEYQANIFERFYRVDKARSRNEGGSGLGLAICKWVAEIHGGNISVSSILGEGSLFTVFLPYQE